MSNYLSGWEISENCYLDDIYKIQSRHRSTYKNTIQKFMPDSSKIDDEISQFDGNNKKRSYGSINSKNIRSLDKHDVKSEQRSINKRNLQFMSQNQQYNNLRNGIQHRNYPFLTAHTNKQASLFFQHHNSLTIHENKFVLRHHKSVNRTMPISTDLKNSKFTLIFSKNRNPLLQKPGYKNNNQNKKVQDKLRITFNKYDINKQNNGIINKYNANKGIEIINKYRLIKRKCDKQRLKEQESKNSSNLNISKDQERKQKLNKQVYTKYNSVSLHNQMQILTSMCKKKDIFQKIQLEKFQNSSRYQSMAQYGRQKCPILTNNTKNLPYTLFKQPPLSIKLKTQANKTKKLNLYTSIHNSNSNKKLSIVNENRQNQKQIKLNCFNYPYIQQKAVSKQKEDYEKKRNSIKLRLSYRTSKLKKIHKSSSDYSLVRKQDEPKHDANIHPALRNSTNSNNKQKYDSNKQNRKIYENIRSLKNTNRGIHMNPSGKQK